MKAIDVCLVATRRPDLLGPTMTSFKEGLFGHFEIRRIIANIDPVFGSESDEARCVEIIRSHDPQADISRPKTAGFAAAVAGVWARSTAAYVLHLEDDWRLRKPVLPDDILPHFEDDRTAQVSFNHDNKNWDSEAKGPFCYIRRRRRMFGLKIPLKIKIPNILTGPSFFRGSLARSAAALMDPRFDPEKQFCRGLNDRLEAHVLGLRNRILGQRGDYYIEDLGWAWRKERGIEKAIVAGAPVWTQASPPGDRPATAGLFEPAVRSLGDMDAVPGPDARVARP